LLFGEFGYHGLQFRATQSESARRRATAQAHPRRPKLK
jgi:hypothetical protein